MSELFRIIHEDDELLVINKPAGLVCHPSKTGEMSSLIGRVRLHLGNGARPHLVNRLDRETSGVTLVAKKDETARELRRLWEDRQVEKEYLAIVHGHVLEASGVIEEALGKDEQSRVAVKDCVRADGSPARTEFDVERRFELDGAKFSLLRVRLETGRKHQIRIHLAHIRHPVVGDNLYGAPSEVRDRRGDKLSLARNFLHAAALEFEHPASHETLSFTTPLPAELKEFMANLEAPDIA